MPAAKKLFTTIAVLLFLTGASCFAAEPEKDTAEIQLNFSDINKTLDGITKKINGGSVSREESDDYIATLNSLQNQILNEQKQDTATLQSMTQKISALNGLADENGKDVTYEGDYFISSKTYRKLPKKEKRLKTARLNINPCWHRKRWLLLKSTKSTPSSSKRATKNC